VSSPRPVRARGRPAGATPGKRAITTATIGATLLALSVCCAHAQESYGAPPADLQDRLAALVRSYPDWIAGFDAEFLILRNGTKLAISDRRTNKSFDQLLENPDIDDMFYAAYPAGTTPRQPAKNFDPGRVRFEPLFVAMYGDCKKNEVTGKLRAVEWLPHHHGGRIMVTSVNGVDKALAAVSRELDVLPDDFLKVLTPSSGTYNCREIAGSTARSMHAYAAAIDINTAYSDYWRWSVRPNEPVWKNRVPIEIARVFERHGFIWGAYWYHYDTMHFEYRPELLPAPAAAKPD
jgi:D-alanyl-D-alanine carboxypeptidase-like protein